MRTEAEIRAAVNALAAEAPAASPVLTAVLAEIANPQSARRRRPYRRRPAWRKVAPLMAALTVAALAAALTVASGARTAATNPSGLLASLPRYYIALVGPARGSGPTRAVVFQTRTGARIASVLPPRPYHTFVAVTGAADDDTFVLAARPGGRGASPTEFFLGHLDPDAGRLSLSGLPVPSLPAGWSLTGLALSPNGSHLAIAAASDVVQQTARLAVYSLATGAAKTWAGPGLIGNITGAANAGDMDSVSWGSNTALAVSYGTAGLGYGIRLLDTAGPDGSLAAHSRLVVPLVQPDGYMLAGAGVLTPGGQKIVAPVRQVNPALWSLSSGGELEEFSARTGRSLAAFLRRSAAGIGSIGWVNSSGSLVVLQLAAGGTGSVSYFVYGAGHTAAIPGGADSSHGPVSGIAF